MPPRQPSPALHWCFTLNNPELFPDELVESLTTPYTYLVFQLEVGEQGTPHYQGYVAWQQKQRLTALTALLPGAHWEVARGTPTQNRDYCTKPEGRLGDFCEFGELPAEKGARTDLALLHSRLKDGLTNKEYVSEFFTTFVRYPNLVANYIAASIEARDPRVPLHSWLLVGPPGLGKSRLAGHLGKRLADGRIFRHCLGKWFDGYVGERTILLDDFSGSSIPFTQFKHLLDRYPLRVELKGLSCEMAATNFIITTNQDPKEWWQETVTGRYGHDAIFRRIGKVLAFCAPNQFRVYSSYAHYSQDLLRLLRDGEIFRPTQDVQEVLYEEEEAFLPEEILQAQVH